MSLPIPGKVHVFAQPGLLLVRSQHVEHAWVPSSQHLCNLIGMLESMLNGPCSAVLLMTVSRDFCNLIYVELSASRARRRTVVAATAFLRS